MACSQEGDDAASAITLEEPSLNTSLNPPWTQVPAIRRGRPDTTGSAKSRAVFRQQINPAANNSTQAKCTSTPSP